MFLSTFSGVSLQWVIALFRRDFDRASVPLKLPDEKERAGLTLNRWAPSRIGVICRPLWCKLWLPAHHSIQLPMLSLALHISRTCIDIKLARSAYLSMNTTILSIFVLVMNTVFFAFGAQKVSFRDPSPINRSLTVIQLCALDFRENVSTSKQAGFRDRWHSRFAGFQKWSDGRGKKQEIDPRKRDTSSSTSSALAVPVSYGSTKTAPTTTVGSSMPECEDKSTPTEECDRSPDLQSMTKMGGVPTRHKSRTPSFTSVMATIWRIPPTEAPDAIDIGQQSSFDTKDIYGPTHSSGTHGNVLPVSSNYNTPQAEEAAPISSDQPKSQKYLDFLIAALKNVIHTPASVAVIIGLPCALIQPVKALFVVVDGWSVTRIPYAPDGKPPLAFIIDTTTFIGALAVPGGLILLGASFARLKVGSKFVFLREPRLRYNKDAEKMERSAISCHRCELTSAC